jgi:solute carrier family 25 phosphate transporter 3
MGKFGFYEYFKDVFAKVAGDKAYDYKVIGYSLSSASAELIADVLLCPWEATRVRM